LAASTKQSISLDELLGDPATLGRNEIATRVRSNDFALWLHAGAVAAYVDAMATLLPQSARSQRRGFVDAAWLHDIGKLTIRRDVLLRPGPLTDSEWTDMREHSARGADFLERSAALRDLAPLVRQHHEWHDGRGYPDALCAGKIELGARLIGVADAYDAMTSSRPYRPVMSHDAAVAELLRCSGSQFDPEIVSLFIRATDGLRTRATG
jgi:HD-GYP domain-containing protein (c-di-GMP phosphodiesterase class II)